jgi:coenzyme F420-reducing hydrogenase gamma subunit
MPDKPKIAFYWCASCGGCEESIVDLAEDILEVAQAVDIVFWPVAMDFKRKDVEAMPDGSILATMVNGSIRTSEQEEMAYLLRRKSQILIAYGSCAHTGGGSEPRQPVQQGANPALRLRRRAHGGQRAKGTPAAPSSAQRHGG